MLFETSLFYVLRLISINKFIITTYPSLLKNRYNKIPGVRKLKKNYFINFTFCQTFLLNRVSHLCIWLRERWFKVEKSKKNCWISSMKIWGVSHLCQGLRCNLIGVSLTWLYHPFIYISNKKANSFPSFS